VSEDAQEVGWVAAAAAPFDADIAKVSKEEGLRQCRRSSSVANAPKKRAKKKACGKAAGRVQLRGVENARQHQSEQRRRPAAKPQAFFSCERSNQSEADGNRTRNHRRDKPVL
jgi:hypothetical protein